jgi:hypothetical protein
MATTISSSISEKPFLFPHLYFLPSLVFEILLVTNDAVVRVNAPASPKSGGAGSYLGARWKSFIINSNSDICLA